MSGHTSSDPHADRERLRHENERLSERLRQLEARRLEADESRIPLDILFSTLPYLFFLIDSDDTYRAFRGGHLRAPHVPPEAFIGRRIDEVLPEPARTAVMQAVREVRTLQQPRVIEYELAGAEGDEWFEARIVPLDQGRVGALVSDVTARRQRDAALRASEGRFRTIFLNEPECVKVVGVDGRLLDINPAGMAMLEVESVEEARNLAAYVHPADRAAFHELLRRVLGGERASLSFRIVGRQGTERWVETVAAPLREAAGGVTAMIAVTRDVTERLRLQQQLHRAQTLESIGRLAGGVAHDFNNLLTVILGFTQILQSRLRSDPAALEDLAEVHGAGVRARELTQQLLAVARRQITAPRIVDLNAIVTNMERLLHRLMNEDVELATRLGPGLWPIQADPSQIEQVLMNLAVNARDAMPRGGTFTIETRNLDAGAEPSAEPPALEQDAVMLKVTDTGVGMSGEVVAHVFEPFFTTKPVGQGTGLGLATVYGAVHQSGGRIQVESTPGKGTAFTLCFPRAVESAAPAAGEPGPEAAGGSETVLVVEDDPAVRALTVRVLREAGYLVRAAASGPEALNLLAREPEAIDLLVTDVVMPQMSGPEVAERLEGQNPGLRVLYVSGYPRRSADHHGVLIAADEFLAKPFTGPQLRARVREVLDRVPRP